MGATRVSHPNLPGNYPTAARVTAHVASALGVREDTAHQWLYGHQRLNLRVARMIEGLIRSGDRAALSHFFAPIDAAMRGIPAPADTDQLAEQAEIADADEGVAQTAYQRNQCEATARAYVLALDTERALNLEERQAIAAHWGLA